MHQFMVLTARRPCSIGSTDVLGFCARTLQVSRWVVGLDYFRDQNQLGAADNPFYRQNPN